MHATSKAYKCKVISEGGINMTAAVQDLAFTTITKKICQISTV